MSLTDLEITRKWPDKSVTSEMNWDAIKVPLDEFSNFTNRNLCQLAKDCLGDTYEFDNDGNANNAKNLLVALTTDMAITGGNIDGAIIGGTEPEIGKFSSLNVATTTGYYVVPALNFIPRAAADRYARSVAGAYPYLFNVNALFFPHYFLAPVHLPQGATMTNVTMYYYRIDAASAINITFKRWFNDTNVDQQIRYIEGTSTAGNAFVSLNIFSFGVVDNAVYNYVLDLTIDDNDDIGDVGLCSVVITYTITSTYP